MAVTLKKSHLQTNVYTYIWTRDDDDQPYAGLEDRRQVDKDEGYEVLYFLEKLLNKHDKKTLPDVNAAEDALHSEDLSDVTDRVKLTTAVEKILGW
ncbi:hypothetical protein ALO95_200124 [Pseudomonas syringae pv. antirrhini]|jgi:hypothetical protein|uniref:Uncharacterized protein n=1 Tax=Pseudomonas syringae pv. antirrhini TaxID=251702 RepID=A0A0P9JKX8_9PSED|nr:MULTISPECIES: hypothetical protein [Pseudomonas]KPW43321.1 Uncharacterized protein ALO88_03254 [Pseudomonas syringae pv. antirrhini]QXG33201.1 hypothetical protein KTT61_13840 [Pseudomonas viridiflava]RMP34210.1 hypothetical protein ALQ23_200363 [Pseudomonas syringae pv. antirrhini]RMW26084.1 hypothetical protein ALO95_200124 [Pseudomonas syringae pv. antirrhini]WIN06866.1 hypothetical protein QQF68_25390 [Pseudomonas syringae pv. antirrhini str. 126]